MKLALATLAAASIVATVHADAPFADLTFDEALARAADEGKVVMVQHLTPAFPWVDTRQVVWQDEAVLAWMADHVVAIASPKGDRRIDGRHIVLAAPTLVFFDPEGREIDRLIGILEPADLLRAGEHFAVGEELPHWQHEEIARKLVEPNARQAHALSCARKGLHELALEHFLWCWDEGPKHAPKYESMRGLFLAQELVALGRDYPPALDALLARRNALERQLFAIDDPQAVGGPTITLAFVDLHLGASEDRSRGRSAPFDPSADVQRILHFWDRLVGSPTLRPDVAAASIEKLFPLAASPLIEARRYRDVLAAMGNEPERYALRQFDIDLPQHVREPRELAVGTLACGYAALLGLGEVERAGILARSIARFDPTYDTYSELSRYAREHGGENADAALAAVLEHAERTLEEKDFRLLQRIR